MGNIFVEKYGEPDRWQCPDCGVLFDIYPALPFEHLCSSQIRYAPAKVYYFFRGNPLTGLVEFCLTGDPDHTASVKCTMPGGEYIEWQKYSDGDLTVFRGPKDYDVRFGIDFRFDKRLLRAVPMPDHLAQKEAMRYRVTG